VVWEDGSREAPSYPIRGKVMKQGVLSIFVILISLTVVAATRPQGHNIRGKVRSSFGQAMPRVLVELQTGNGAPVSQTVTNNEGDFYFGGLGGNSYNVIVSAPDYNPASERVEFVRRVEGDEPGETRVIELILTLKAGEPVASPKITFAQNVPKAARDSLDQAMRFLREAKSQEAIAALEEAIKLFPDYFDAHFTLANELIKQEQLDRAITELEHARRINPKESRVHQAFSLVLTKQRKFATAAAVLGQAAQLNPNDPQILLMRATALIEHGATFDPSKSREAAVERARAFSMAEKDLAQAYEVSGKKLSAVHLQMARIHEKRGNLQRAADELEQYLRLTPDAKNAQAIRDAIKKLRGPSR
jgi:Tfp pilus assembly protein PilF